MYTDHPDNILGVNTADNQFISSSVAANADGSMIERLEAIKDQITAVDDFVDTEIAALTTKLAAPTADLVTDATIAQVVGLKADTVAGTSIIAKIKQVIAALLFPTADLATDATIAQVVGMKADTVAGTSIIARAKQIIAAIGTITNTGGTATLGGALGDVANSTVATRLTNLANQTAQTTPKKTAATPVTQNLFTVAGGAVRILAIVGHITTAIAAGANSAKLVHTSTGGAAVDLCAAADIASMAIRKLLTITGIAANPIALSAAEGVVVNAVALSPIIVTPGVLSLNCTAGTTGVIDWFIEYEPMATGATIVAA